MDLTHGTRKVASGPVHLHVEYLEEENPLRTVVLLSEAEAPSSRWPAELLVGLARKFGRCVWFDTRDVGASTWVDEPYDMNDLVADAYAVVCDFEVGPVDVFGRSMGGEVALRLALVHRKAVRSLAVLSATPGRREELGLPEQWLVEKMSDRLLRGMPDTDEGRIEWIVEQWEWFNGPVFPFDRDDAISAAYAEVAAGWRGPNGHGLAVMEADDIVEDLRRLDVPTRIIHGTADCVLPVDHARALHTLIPNSALSLVEGLGHELPAAFVDQLIELIAL